MSGRGLVTSNGGQEVVGDPDWDMFEVVTAAGSETQPGTSQVFTPVSSSQVPSSVCVSQIINPGGESKEETGW